ncbi:hypothetical protein GE21DRAFT_1219411, partial [Neurospora crassa]
YAKIKLEVFKTINDIFKLNTIRICKVTSIVRDRYPDSIYTRRDIYNARAFSINISSIVIPLLVLSLRYLTIIG